jgi:hypothetical protein
LRIKRSRYNGTFIVYNPTNFEKHTHIQKLEIAYVVKRNVERNLLPKTNSIWLLESHIRVSDDEDYIEMVQSKIDSLR